MAAPVLADVYSPGYEGYGTAGTPATMPPNRSLGDLIVIQWVMNGTPTMPTGWTLKEMYGNYTAVAYARVDGTNITTGSSANIQTFGNGGSFVSYFFNVFRITGAIASGDPFDTLHHCATNATTSCSYSLTTTVNETLLILSVGTLGSTTATATGLTLGGSGTTRYAHYGYADGPSTAGASGSKYFTWATNQNNYGSMFSIKPEPPASFTEDSIIGGAKKATANETAIIGGTKKIITARSVIIGGSKTTLV